MKIRKGYVSNSSSSSFICDYCGCHEEGYDISMREVGMMGCEKGHIFCESHMNINIDYKDIAISMINDMIKYYTNSEYIALKRQSNQLERYKEFLAKIENHIDEEYDDFYQEFLDENGFNYACDLPSKYCPICSMSVLSDSDIADYYNTKKTKLNKILLLK